MILLSKTNIPTGKKTSNEIYVSNRETICCLCLTLSKMSLSGCYLQSSWSRKLHAPHSLIWHFPWPLTPCLLRRATHCSSCPMFWRCIWRMGRPRPSNLTPTPQSRYYDAGHHFDIHLLWFIIFTGYLTAALEFWWFSEEAEVHDVFR